MSRTLVVRFRGIAAALRFSLIPIVCAMVVALASEDPRGKVLAAATALAVFCFGLAMHAREALTGRPTRPHAPAQPPVGTGEGMGTPHRA